MLQVRDWCHGFALLPVLVYLVFCVLPKIYLYLRRKNYLPKTKYSGKIGDDRVVRNSTPQEYKNMEFLIARNFLNDSLYTSLFPKNVQKRNAFIAEQVRIILGDRVLGYVIHDESGDFGDVIRGIAIWQESEIGFSFITMIRIIICFLKWLPFRKYSVLLAYLKTSSIEETIMQPHHIKGYFKLLMLVCEVRRKGYGSMVLKNMLLKADREKRACYLETNMKGNVEFYRKNGFEVAKKETIDSLPGVEFSYMIRLPQEKEL